MSVTLGQRLKQLVREKGLEQQEVAAELGMKTPTFNGYVSNKREPSVEKLIHFASYFGVSVDYLIGYSNIRNPYFKHLTDEENEFVHLPDNRVYLELAMDIKNKTGVSSRSRG